MSIIIPPRGNGHMQWPNGSMVWGQGPKTELPLFLAGVGFAIFLFGVSRVGIDFIPSLTNVFWAAGWAVVAYTAAFRADLLAQATLNNKMLLAAAFIATLSALWSLMPSLSAFRGVLLILNIMVGFVAFHHFGLRRTLHVIFWFCLIAQVGSFLLIASGHHAAFDHNGYVPKGLFPHKNNLAMNAVMLFFTSLILFAHGWRRILSLVGAASALTGLILSTSGTGLIVCVLMFGILCGCAVVSYGMRATQFIAGLGLCSLVATVLMIVFSGYNPYIELLNSLGKDTTLTGRTVLWEYAFNVFADHPWLGIGYFTYWNTPETTASSLIIIMGVKLNSFHNNFLDVLVGVGLLGLILFVIAVFGLLFRTLYQFVVTRDALLAWPFAYVCFMLIYCMSEYPLFWNSEYQMLFAFVGAAAAAAPEKLAARHRPEPLGDVELITA
ncbi:MAG: O-antigen ligase family protein [Pseudomonadota bacterium]